MGARCATSPPPPSARPACRRNGVQGMMVIARPRPGRADRAAGGAACVRAERSVSGHQARPRRPDPGGRGRRAGRARGGRASKASRSPRRVCARACSSSACSSERDPPLFERRAPRERAQPRRPATTWTSPTPRHVATLALGDVRRARAPGPARRRSARARAAVGCLRAARHRHVRRLRRPPQALALPDPQRRAAGFSPVEVAIIAQAARYHRKGMPEPGPAGGAVRRGRR